MGTMRIEDPRVCELANELAALKGSSATRAVRDALEHELQREVRGRTLDLDRIRRLQERFAEAPGEWLTDDDLYDADGLPR